MSDKRHEHAKRPAPPAPCDVVDCAKPWLVVVNIREGNAIKTSVKVCGKHYAEFKAGKSPPLRGK